MVLPAGAVLGRETAHGTAGSGLAAAAPSVQSFGPASTPGGYPGLSDRSIPNLLHGQVPTLPGRAGYAPSTLRSVTIPSPTHAAAAFPGPGSANLSAQLAKINATFSKVPGAAAEASVARLIAEGVVPPRAAYLPNLHLLSSPAASPITLKYDASPAPMGLADFGLGTGGPYSVSTPGVLGTLTLSGYNATGGSLYEDTGAYYYAGLNPTTSVTPWQSGVQLNTVVTNVSYPGSNAGVFWTQNVIDFSGDRLQFIDNIWNFTGPNASLNASTLYAYNGTWNVGAYYYDMGPILPLQFPLTIQLYNNASNVGGRTAVTFGYHLTEGLSVYSGVYDTVVFNSLPTTLVPLLTPDFLVDGSKPTYTAGPHEGPLYDAELVFGGPGAGSNSVIDQLSGAMTLAYRSGAVWSPAPSAYDYGADTGETAIGVAGTWQGTTEGLSQGPSILYGLWNTSSGVPSGGYHLQITNKPIYAFDFGGFSGVSNWNLSYVPTGADGVARTYLPPGLSYNFSLMADGFEQINFSLSSAFTGSGSSTFVTVTTPTPQANAWYTPIYMNGSAQALSMAVNTTGWSSGYYVFANLEVDVNLTFNHLNDWGFPEFDLFWSNDAVNALLVYNISQGPDSGGGLCSGAGVPATCYLVDGPATYTDLPGYGGEIVDWNGFDDVFEQLTLAGWQAPIGLEVGGVVALWNVTDGTAAFLSSYDGSFGVWAASSPYFEEFDSLAFDAVALTLLASPNAFAVDLEAEVFGTAVLDEGGAYGGFEGLNATVLSVGFAGIMANGTAVVSTYAGELSTGVIAEACDGLLVLGVFATNDSYGMEGIDVTNSTIAVVDVVNDSLGVLLYDTWGDSLEEFYVNGSTGGWLYGAVEPYVSEFEVTNGSLGLGLEGGTNLTAETIDSVQGSTGLYVEDYGAGNVSDVTVNDSIGVEVVAPSYAWSSQTFHVDLVTVTNGGVGVGAGSMYALFVNNVSAIGLSLSGPSVGVWLDGSEAVYVANVSSSLFGEGLLAVDSFGIFASNLTVGFLGTGTIFEDSVLVVASNVTVASGLPLLPSVGAVLEESEDGQLENVSASGAAEGAYLYDCYEVTTDHVTASAGAVGVFVVDSSLVTANDTSAGAGSFPYASMGVTVNDSYGVFVTNVSANGFAAGVNISGSEFVVVTYVTASNGAAGVFATGSEEIIVNDVLVTTADSVGVVLQDSSIAFIANVTVIGGTGTIALDSTSIWVTYTNVSLGGAIGVLSLGSAQLWVSNTSANFSALGVAAGGSTGIFVESTQATGVGTVGVVFEATNDSWANDTTVTSSAIGVGLAGGSEDHVSHVTATALGTVGPWAEFSVTHLPTTAVLTLDTSDCTIADVSASHYPLALYDNGSSNLFVQGLSASDGALGVMLNGSAYGLLDGLSVSGSWVGLQMNDGAYANVVTASRFDNESGFGVDIQDGFFNLVYDNDFVDDNGAGSTYNATHIQAFSNSATNAFNSSAEIGNYWADWHTYVAGVLAPYYISSGAWDYHPLGAHEGTFAVTFQATGLPYGSGWSVTLGSTTESSVGPSIVFNVYPGTYAFSVTAPSTWSVTPGSGSLVVSTGPIDVPLDFTSIPPVYTVWINESGLTAGTSWSAIFNGVSKTTTGTSLAFDVTAGTYSFQVGSVAGYAVSLSSGTVTVGGNYTIAVTYTSTVVPPPPHYTVWVNETGLPAGTGWTAVFDGVLKTTTGTSLAFTVTAGTYAYQIGMVANYAASVTSGTATVGGNYTILVAFTSTVTPPPVKYTVWINETGLATGTSWSGVFNGVEGTTSGPSLGFTVPAGTYSFQIAPLTGYAASVTGGSVTVLGNYTILVTFTSTAVPPPVRYTVWINETGLTAGTSWSAIFNGVPETTTGASLSFSVPAGPYAYQVLSVAGYSATVTSGTATVGGTYEIAVAFTATSSGSTTSSYVPNSTFNTDWAIALGLAALGVVIGLVALLRRPRAPTPAPAAAWHEPETPEEGAAEGPSEGTGA